MERILAILVVGCVLWTPRAWAGPFGTKNPVTEALGETEKPLSEAEKRRQERRAKLMAARAETKARVVVLQWLGSEVDYGSELLRKNIQARIARPNAGFYPDVDLYQDGRKEPDETLRPLDQRGTVPDSAIDIVMAAVNAIESTPWNALSETEWGMKMYELRDLTEETIWFVDRPELREPLFRAYAEIGYAAENSNNPGPPFFEEVAGVGINYYYYLAAAMASREPSLMSKLTNPERHQSIKTIKDMIDTGEFRPMTLNFEVAGKFRAERFTDEYTVWFNGLEDQVTNLEALYDVPPGRMDVYLKRDDGHSMSMRVEAVRLDDEELQAVRDQARKRMGLEFIRQLMKNPEQCQPDIDGDILNYLAIYQTLHPGAEIYIAIPNDGSVHDILLWKWVPKSGRLIRINDNTGGFPVRFVGLAGSGLTFSGMALKNPVDDPTLNPNAPVPEGKDALSLAEEALIPQLAALPVSFEVRGHWHRLMVGLQVDYAANLQEGKWTEVPQTGQGAHHVEREVDGTFYEPRSPGGNTISRDFNTTTNELNGNASSFSTPSVREFTFQRGAFLTVGAVLGRDAPFGFGPRIAARTGWYNAPHAVDLTGHAGWAIEAPLGKGDKPDGRVKPIIDTDLFAGVALPFRDSLLLITNQYDAGDGLEPMVDRDNPNQTIWAPLAKGSDGACLVNVAECKTRRIGRPLPTFGFTIKAGITF